MDTNRYISPTLQIPGQEDWARDVYGAGSNMGYVEHNMSGFFPNYCYGPYSLPPFASYGPVYMGVQPMYMPMMGVSYFVPPSNNSHVDQYEPKPDAMSRASRKSRIARRRVHETEEHQPRASTVSKPAHGVLTGKQEFNVALQSPPVASAAQACAHFRQFQQYCFMIRIFCSLVSIFSYVFMAAVF